MCNLKLSTIDKIRNTNAVTEYIRMVFFGLFFKLIVFVKRTPCYVIDLIY